MRSSTYALSFLASLAIAQPHRQGHQHAKLHEVRDAAPAIKWVTEWEYTTEVIPVTKTVWVSEGFVAPSSAPETTPTSAPETTPTSSASATKKATVPAQFFQPASEPVSSSTTLSTVVSVAPAPISTSSAQPTTTSVPPPPPPPPAAKALETTTTAPPPAPVAAYTPPPPPEPTTTQAPAPVVAAPVIAAPIASSAPVVKPSLGSAAGPCSEGSSCNGDITYYEAGLGACGWTTDGETDDVIALSHLMMGTQSNGNPFCGKTVTIKLNGKTITAKVVDKCMGCEMHAIDLSNHAFSQLEDFGVGRTQAEWYFN